jgi:hypothetical protein
MLFKIASMLMMVVTCEASIMFDTNVLLNVNTSITKRRAYDSYDSFLCLDTYGQLKD